MIWQFDNSQIYMLGSVHVMKEDDNNHQSVINDVYNKVSKIVFETSLDFEQIPLLTSYEDDKLSNNISKELFRDTKKAWLKYGLEYSQLENSKIWNAAISIMFRIFNKNGFLTENGIDKIIWNKSKEDKKEIEWLESQSAGLSSMDNSPIEEQHNFLIKAVRNKNETIKEITLITEAWNAGDEESLLCILNSALEELPSMFSSLIIERNTKWLNKFITALNADAPVLFVVGALHCIGKCSIQNMLLENHGYTSKRINTEL